MGDVLKRFLSRYGKWIVALGLLNFTTWCAFERLHSKELGYGDLWPIRMSLLSALLLFDNLCVLWWYADRTHALAVTADQQLGFQRTLYHIENKPIVFIDAERPFGGGDIQFVARNVGPGLAVNVYYVKRVNEGLWSKTSLGAIESRGQRRLLHDLEREFTFPSSESVARLLIIEGMWTRTQQWIITLNALGKDGNVHHRLVEFDLHSQTMLLDEVLKHHGDRFERELIDFHNQVRK